MADYKKLIETGESICAQAIKRGADAADIYLEKSESTSFSIENNKITFSSSGKDFGIGIRVLKNKKLGFAYCTRVSDTKNAIDRALAASHFSPESPFAFPRPQKIKKIGGLYDKRIEKISPEQGLDMTDELLAAALTRDAIAVTEGGVGYGTDSFAVVNSEGIAVGEDGTSLSASISTIMKSNDDISTGFEFGISRRYDVDFEMVGKKAAELAIMSRNARPLRGTEKRSAVLTPLAFAELFAQTVTPSFYGERAQKGESFYTKKIGKKVAVDFLSVYEDPTRAHAANSSAFDEEGVASKKRPLIKNGILQSFLYDTYTAKKYGQKSTASAVRAGFKTPPVTGARQLIISGTRTKTEDVIADVKNGVLIYNVLGAHTANAVSGDFSVNSSLLFRIEHGEVTNPIKHAMLSGNMPALLTRCRALCTDDREIPGGNAGENMITPTVRLEGIRVTG